MKRKTVQLPLCALGEDEGEAERLGSVLLVLNSTLPAHFECLWRNSAVRVCADGGANRVHDLGRQLVPDAVCGDLDSVRQDVLELFAARGARVVRDKSQDTDDITKALQLIRESYATAAAASRVIVAGWNGRNITQELANFNAFFRFPELDLLFVSDHNVVTSVPPDTECSLAAPARFGCGMLPLGSPCARCVTAGLRWNVAGESLRFGGLISSSNEMLATTATVTVSDRIIWTWDIKHKILG
jgi:thiamine pyrophosphokinase